MPLSILTELQIPNKINKTKVALVAYGNVSFKIKPLEEITLMCEVNNIVTSVLFIVADVKNQWLLLGLQDCINCKISAVEASFKSLDNIIEKYPSVFEGLGEFPK